VSGKAKKVTQYSGSEYFLFTTSNYKLNS